MNRAHFERMKEIKLKLKFAAFETLVIKCDESRRNQALTLFLAIVSFRAQANARLWVRDHNDLDVSSLEIFHRKYTR